MLKLAFRLHVMKKVYGVILENQSRDAATLQSEIKIKDLKMVTIWDL